MAGRRWLFKTDADTFGWSDLKRLPGWRTAWDGVRNYQARNDLRDDVRAGDGVLFYHSQGEKAVMGTCTVTKPAFPDATQFDRKHKGYDPGADRADPRWFAVEIKVATEFPTPVTLDEMRAVPGLAKMVLLQRGSRLSIQPVTAEEWAIVETLGTRRP